MIHIYTTWGKEEVDYVEEARKRHEPEVRQISRDALRQLGDAMVIHIFLSNKEQNKTKTLTDKDVYQRVKDEYGWDQASVVKDGILNISSMGKDGVEELKAKKKLLTEGLKGLPDVKPQKIIIKFAKNALPFAEIYTVSEKIKKLETAKQKAEKQQKIIDQCWKDEKNPESRHFGNINRCIIMQEKTLINFQSDIFESVDYEAFDPENMKKIQKIMSK